MTDLSNTELAEKWDKLTREDFFALLARLEAVTRERDEARADDREARQYRDNLNASVNAERRARRAAEADRDRYKAAYDWIVGTTEHGGFRIPKAHRDKLAALAAAGNTMGAETDAEQR
jgi:hypothetical protein